MSAIWFYPASFQLGTHQSVLIASILEGDDKPYKYPGMYQGVNALVINRFDLLPYVTFDMDYFRHGVGDPYESGCCLFPTLLPYRRRAGAMVELGLSKRRWLFAHDLLKMGIDTPIKL